MKKQYFKLEIIQVENGTQATGEFRCSPKFLTHYLGRVLKESPELIPIFLDATGVALIGSGQKLNSDTPKTLEYFAPTENEKLFFDEIFG